MELIICILISCKNQGTESVPQELVEESHPLH